MKRIALLAVIGAGLMGLPSTTAAQSGATNCPVGASGTVTVGALTLKVTGAHVCVYERTSGTGGELVVNPAGCSYVNAWRTNPGTPGYAGICTGTPSRGPGCNPDDPSHTPGANTGGCFQINGAPAAVNQALNTFPVGLVTASFICGNTNGEDPQNTPRDGCSIPGDWWTR